MRDRKPKCRTAICQRARGPAGGVGGGGGGGGKGYQASAVRENGEYPTPNGFKLLELGRNLEPIVVLRSFDEFLWIIQL